MKKTSTFFRFAVLSCLMLMTSPSMLHAQTLGKTSRELVAKNAFILGLTQDALSESRVSDSYSDKISGTTMVYLQQTYKGVDVFNSIQTIAFKGDRVAVFSGKRIENVDALANSRSSSPAVSAQQAVKSAATHLGLPAPQLKLAPALLNGKKHLDFGKTDISTLNLTAKLLWIVNEDHTGATLCWQIMIQPKAKADLWLVNVDAKTGTVLSKENLNISCDFTPVHKNENRGSFSKNGGDDYLALIPSNRAGYGVIAYPAESPSIAPPSLAKNPWSLAGANNPATTLQWNNDGNQVFDSTRGNNVLAQEDLNGNNGFGKGAVTRKNNVIAIAYRPDFSKDPTSTDNQKICDH